MKILKGFHLPKKIPGILNNENTGESNAKMTTEEIVPPISDPKAKIFPFPNGNILARSKKVRKKIKSK